MTFSTLGILVAVSTVSSAIAELRGKQWSGYWEAWVNEGEDTSWWEDDVPGNCAAGCVIAKGFMDKSTTFNSVNYAFATLATLPNPDQGDCDSTPCPIWDGSGLYIEKDTAVTASSTVDKPSASVVAVAEFCRLARQHPSGPKRCLISLGGWSDWARIGTEANAASLARLVSKLVLHSFADGIDLDFEHLSEFTSKYGGEFAAFAALINGIRQEFDAVTPQIWNSTVTARLDALKASGETTAYYTDNIKYLAEVAANGLPRLEISYTTRFNAFVSPTDPFNWLMPNSSTPGQPYDTDDEGTKVYPPCADAIDTVNIMSYDQDMGMILNVSAILDNFATYGKIPTAKLNAGFEPGEQGGGGTWEGEGVDLATCDAINKGGFGGAMIWTANPDKESSPHSYDITSQFVKDVANVMPVPVWPWGTAPHYTPYAGL